MKVYAAFFLPFVKIELHKILLCVVRTMKAEYTCSRCLKDFTSNAKFERHSQRKNPCKPSKAVETILKANPVIETVKDATGSFRKNSLEMNKKIKKEDRKNQGIFFTPKKARDLVFEVLNGLHATPKNILEPSFGSGEFLQDVKEKYPSASITGVELNEELYKSVKIGGVNTVHANFLKYESKSKFDLILGNPPYFLIKEKNKNCMVGRPNIYVAFLYKCLESHLEDDGYLAFVLPTSLFNCSYYEPMRKYIYEKCMIHFVKELDVKYYQTQQDTMLIVLQKKKDPEHKYIFQRSGNIYISPMAKDLSDLVSGTKTLDELGFDVKTGEVVWNQEKEKLSSEPGTLLIYNTNIVDCELRLNNIQDSKNEKKQYIKNFHKTPITQPAILVNRGYGNVFAFNFVFVQNQTFYAENHVNMILARTKEAEKMFPLIIDSFQNTLTKMFVDSYIGNGAISASELHKVLPIFLPDH